MSKDRTGGRRDGRGADAPASAENARLVHDLSVHQIELETQNEELQRIRADLEVALASYTELFDFAPIGYLTVGPDGKIDASNHAASRIFARARMKLAGCAIEELVVLRDRPKVGKLVSAALSSNEREDDEVELVTTAGRRIFVHLTAILLVSRGSKLLVAVQDVTIRRERDEQLANTERALREADHRKDEFLAMLSHELRNPLAPIRTALYVLERAEPDSEPARKAYATIDRQVTHLARLVDDLLDVTRIARGKVHLQKQRVELGELLRRTVDDHRATFEAAQVALEARFDPGPFWLDADPARLVQSLSNVFGNALKFTPPGGRVVVRLERSEGGVDVAVEDNGAGIRPDVLPHLFEPFAQGPQSMDRSRGGLGLGLAMVKGLVELHGGSVALESPGLGKGSVLRMAFPVLDEPEPASEEEAREEPVRPRRVLVIEDNMDAADTLKEALEMNGHTVAVAYEGIGGLAKARTFHPDIVICDLGLPGMDGFAVARAFHATEGEAPYLVALSGYAQPEDLERATAAGFDRHIAKPPSLDTLDRMLEEAPERHEPSAMLH